MSVECEPGRLSCKVLLIDKRENIRLLAKNRHRTHHPVNERYRLIAQLPSRADAIPSSIRVANGEKQL